MNRGDAGSWRERTPPLPDTATLCPESPASRAPILVRLAVPREPPITTLPSSNTLSPHIAMKYDTPLEHSLNLQK